MAESSTSASASLRMSDSYKKDSKMQQTATGRAIAEEVLAKRILRYIEENQEEFNSAAPFRVVEYGAADGSNSILVLTQIIETIRSKSETKPIEIICNDLPTADLSGLFGHLNPLKEKFKNVFIQGNGDSFYNQVVADNSADMIFSFTSVHWLQGTPCFLNASIFSSYAAPNIDETANDVWRKQAENDWRQFLECRRRELKPNGFLYVSTLNYQTPASSSNKLQAEVGVEGMDILISVLEKYGIAEHKAEFNLPMAIRQKKEFLEPFEGSDPIGLVNEYYSDFTFEIPAVKEMLKGNNTEAFKAMMKGGTKAVTGPYYKTKLAKIDSLTDELREEIFENLYEEMYANVGKYLESIKEEDRGCVDYCEMIFSKP